MKATTEVQAAARKVAEENYWLQSLLEEHGVSPVKIKEYLNSSRAASRSLGSEVGKVPGKNVPLLHHMDFTSPRPPLQAAQFSSGPPASSTVRGGGELGLLSPTPTLGSPGCGNLLYSIDNSFHEANAQPSNKATETPDDPFVSEKPSTPGPSCQACEQEGGVKGVDETSCEDAARIIASMRGHEDPDVVWPELGCSATKSCMVKNIAIFQMVDGRE